jgi:hypothetical protein
MKYEGETDYMYQVRRQAESKRLDEQIKGRIEMFAKLEALRAIWLGILKSKEK